MRHSRKAVMREHYKLYMKKNIFNGRYFVRNVQIAVGLVFVMIVFAGIIAMCFSANHNHGSSDIHVDVKNALFGERVTEKEIQKQEKAELEVASAVVPGIVSRVSVVETVSENIEQMSKEEPVQEQTTEEEPSLFEDRCIANVEEALNVRLEPDAESDFVGQMNVGAIAMVLGEEGEWTKIKSGDVYGYVLSEYVLTGEEAEAFSADYVTLRGTVLEDGVNIRADQSTDAEILQVMDKDAVVSVLELSNEETEATISVDENLSVEALSDKTEADEVISEEQEIIWVTVSLDDGRVGYVSADYIHIEELYELAVSAEELQRQAEEAAKEELERQQVMESSDNSYDQSYDQSSSDVATQQSSPGATTEPQKADSSGECLGTFTVTAYCNCEKCSSGHNRTASGTVPTEGRTIAADTSILPYGTKVVIDGVVYTVEDCGSGVNGNHIDIYFSTHEKALAYGRKTIKVYKY